MEVSTSRLGHLHHDFIVGNNVPSALQQFVDDCGGCAQLQDCDNFCGPTGYINVPLSEMGNNNIVSGTDQYGRPFFAFKDIYGRKKRKRTHWEYKGKTGVFVIFKRYNDVFSTRWAFECHPSIERDLGGGINTMEMDRTFFDKLDAHLVRSSKRLARQG